MMDSQLTLVDIIDSPDRSGQTVFLSFDSDDMRNTALHIRGTGLPSYSVVTARDTTTVCAGDRLIATVTRNKFRRDQITFPGSKPINLGDWLKAPMLATCPLVFQACDRQFEWSVNIAEQLLVLRESNYPAVTVGLFSQGPIAGHAPFLAIKPGIDDMKDMIVLSCILVRDKLQVMSARQRMAVYAMTLL